MKEKFARSNILFFQYLKRDYKKIIVWILGLGIFAGGLIPAFIEIAKGDGAIAMFETLQNPAMIALIGPTSVTSPTEYTLAVMYAHEMLLFSALFAFTLSILHVILHTRKAEDLGLSEIIRSFQVGRQANSLAVILETILINILLALFISVILISFQIESLTILGTFTFGASIGVAGILGAVIGLLMAQIMPVSSAATGSSLAIMGILYILRGITDISNLKLSMLNPLAWSYLTFPFTKNNWLPILLSIVFALAIIIIAFILEEKRDLGAGYLPEKEGRSRAKKSLLSVPGLFYKLNRGVIIGWLITFLVLGISYGAIYGDMGSFLESNEFMKEMFTYTGLSIEESFTGTVMMVMIGLVIILPVTIINKLFSEEKGLYLNQIYGTKVKRSEIYFTNIILAIVVSILGIFLSAIGLGGSALSVLKSDNIKLLDFIIIGFNLFPVILFFIGLNSFILGWIPKLSKTIYVYLTYAFFLDYFQTVLDVPNWVIKTAPQSWLPKMPMESFDLKIFLLVFLISVILIILGFVGYKKRDMIESV